MRNTDPAGGAADAEILLGNVHEPGKQPLPTWARTRCQSRNARQIKLTSRRLTKPENVDWLQIARKKGLAGFS